jgi:hypothetical protein
MYVPGPYFNPSCQYLGADTRRAVRHIALVLHIDPKTSLFV